MGRRDSDGKRKTWMLEAGDWEKLYAAFMRAKEKNDLLDLRLERKLLGIERQKIQRDGNLFNDIFEQKQLVFKYKCEVNEMKRDARRKGRPESYKKEGMSFSTQSMTRNETCSVPKSNDDTILRSKLIVGSGGITSRSDTFITDTGKATALPLLNSDPSAKVTLNSKESKPDQKAETIALLNESEEKNEETKDFVKGEITKLPIIGSPVKRSTTMPDLSRPAESQLTPRLNKLDIITAEYWIGDPIAIRSVRRPRLNPNEMSDHCQPYGEARKLMVNMPKYPLCSRNCNKPGAELETLANEASVFTKLRTQTLVRQLTRLSQSQEHLPNIRQLSTNRNGVSDTLEDGKTDNLMHPIQEKEQDKLPDLAIKTPNETHNTSNNKPLQTQIKNFVQLPYSAPTTKSRSGESHSKRHIKSVKTDPLRSPSSSYTSRDISTTVKGIIDANKNVPINAPIDVVVRVQKGNLGVKSLTDTTRKVTQMADQAQHRSITTRQDTVIVDKNSKYKSHKVKEVIRYLPTKASKNTQQTEVA